VRANFLGFNDIVLLVVEDISINNEVLVATLTISTSFVGLVFEDTYRGRIDMRAYTDEYVCVVKLSFQKNL